MDTHPRYAVVPRHLLAAAVRDDVGRLDRCDLAALTHWMAARVGPLLPEAEPLAALQVFHVVPEAVYLGGVHALEESRHP